MLTLQRHFFGAKADFTAETQSSLRRRGMKKRKPVLATLCFSHLCVLCVSAVILSESDGRKMAL